MPPIDLQSMDGAAEALPAAWPSAGAREHVVQFYEADTFLLDAVADFIGTTLRLGDAGVVIATKAHREGIEKRLQAAGVDVPAALDAGRYIALDAAEVLPQLLVHGQPDDGRFNAVVGGIIAQVAQGGRRVRCFGEMVALLAEDGKHAAAVHLEQLWNELQQTRPFALFCAYPMDCMGGAALTEQLRDVCAAHTRVIPAESYTELGTVDERLRAITALQQKARSLEAALAAQWAARKEAEAALRLRDEFLSIAAHELRTPITSLSGQAQLLQRRLARNRPLEPAELLPALDTIRGQADKLARLVGQLLDISRLQAGKLALELQHADMTALARQVAAVAQSLSEQHSINVVAPPTLEAWIDPLRVEQVLTNLLDNAVKYSPAGGPIDVTVALADAATAELSVRDHGLGIPAEKRAHLFDRFYQAHAEGNRGGMGLGLYISRQIVELHGGEIYAEFPPDGGACFVAHLPIGLT